MDIVERLTLESAQADTMIACEHRHRYAFAATLCAGRRVLDLCCGSGYGSAILAGRAREVVGVDNDAATLDTAQVTVARQAPNVSFELADAIAFLQGPIAERFDVIVCFEGLEHLREAEQAIALLSEHARHGVRVIASVPNDKLFEEHNPYHVTTFGYDEARRAFAGMPEAVMIPQFLAEGSFISPPGAAATDDAGADVEVRVGDRNEPEYANHFIFLSGFAAEEVAASHHGRLQVVASPLFNRWAEDLKRGAAELRRENARLARGRLGRGSSAAATTLARLTEREQRVSALEERCRLAEARVAELERELARAEAIEERVPETDLPAPAQSEPEPEPDAPRVPALTAVPTGPLAVGPDGDPNSWEMRRRRAAEVLIPWIEQTIPLAGKTVLEYGCGNAAVSCAFAERAERVVGLDIDATWIEEGKTRVQERGLRNVELELHDVGGVLEAAAAHRGAVDVVLLYAVLEHLTVPERLAVLRMAREVASPGGAVVVCETPNRLIYPDHHTAQMPFFHLLPDELALEYYPHSEREFFTGAIDAAVAGGREAALEAIARWGRGVSYHEFEVAFGDLSRHVMASSYDTGLFRERPVHPEELMLARYLEHWRPDLAPAWSRYWLDLILTPAPLERRGPFLRPWSFDTTDSAGVAWVDERLLLKGPSATLWINLPQPTSRLVIGSAAPDGTWTSLTLSAHGGEQTLRSDHTAPAHALAYTSFTLDAPTQRLALSASHQAEIFFVGYDA